MHRLIRYIPERREQRDRWVAAMQKGGLPLRVIDGAVDPISGAHMVARYRELIPQPDTVLLDGIGHYPQTEAPEAVLEHYWPSARGWRCVREAPATAETDRRRRRGRCRSRLLGAARGAQPGATDLADAQRVLAGLADRALVSVRGWSPAEVFNHCAQSIEYSMSGYPELAGLVPWQRRAPGLRRVRDTRRHAPRAGRGDSGAQPLDQPASQAQALARLQRAFADSPATGASSGTTSPMARWTLRTTPGPM